MLKRIREEKTEDGFTLIELMVVVLIISILIAIAIPTFLGAREGAEDRSAQSNVRNALTAAKVYYADEGRWVDASGVGTTDTSALIRALVNQAEPSLAMQDALVTDASAANAVTAVFDVQDATFVAYSESGTCFYMLEVATGGTAGTYFDDQDVAANGACPAAAADPAVGNLGAWEQGGW